MINEHTDQQDNTGKPLWSDAATARLAHVPAGSIRDMAHKAVNTIAVKSGIDEITAEFVEKILDVFQKGSIEVTETLSCDDEARAGLSRAPKTVHGMLVREIENWATSHGKNVVTADIVDNVKAKWKNKGSFHLNPNDPRAN